MHPSTLPRQAVLACPKAAARPTNPAVGGAAARLRRRRRRPPTHATRSCRRQMHRADEPLDALGVDPLGGDVTRSAPARAGAAVVGAQRRTRARTLGVRGDRRHGRVDADQELGRAAPQPEHVQLTGDRRVARRAEGGVVHAPIAAQRRRRHRAPRRRMPRCCCHTYSPARRRRCHMCRNSPHGSRSLAAVGANRPGRHGRKVIRVRRTERHQIGGDDEAKLGCDLARSRHRDVVSSSWRPPR